MLKVLIKTFFIYLLIFTSFLSCKDEATKNTEEITDPSTIEWLKDYKEPKDKWGYIDLQGNMIIEDIYDDVRDFDNGIALVNYKGRWAYINEKGSYLIKPAYLNAHDFGKEEIALVQSFDRKYFYIDKQGKKLFECPSEECESFKNGFALFAKNEMYGILDKNGKEICPPSYQMLLSTFDNFFIAQRGNKFGIVDQNGLIKLDFNFDQIMPLSGDFFRLKSNNQTFYYNKNLSKELGPYDNAEDFNGTYAIVIKNSKSCIIDKSGKVIYTSNGNISYGGEGKFVENKSGKFKYIDAEGNDLFNQLFDATYKFKEGIAGIQKNEAWGYIDEAGKEIIPPSLPIIWDSNEKRVRFISNIGYGFLDTKAKVVIAPKYLEARDFKEGKARVSLVK